MSLKKFKAVVEESHDGLGWTVVRLPFDAVQVWKGKKIRMRVRGTVNGAAFRTSLFPHKDGGQMLLVNKALQKAAKAALGVMVSVAIEPDMEERQQAAVHPLLEKIFKQEKALKKFYDGLSDSMQRDIATHLAEPKNEATRQARVEALAERMLLTMEGEKELPPILVQVFKRYPKAMDGWKQMTPVQRRSHLMGVFYYKTPESREKRAVKAAQDAVQRATKEQV